MVTQIDSDSLINVDTPFKVSAGPGAGKTHWLVKHIFNVLSHSKRLGVTRRIACISYTNVGVQTILERLPLSLCVEVCTIHSFLFNYVVKPYLRFEAESLKICIDKLHLVDTDTLKTYGLASQILQSLNKMWINTNRFVSALKKCYWHWSPENSSFESYKPKFPVKAKDFNGENKRYNIPQIAYDAYITYVWEKGIISYDDVLYISMYLLNKHPEIYKLLNAQFPYFFIDEFQDSIPPIVNFVKKMGEMGSIIGVVGDKGQTIYDFIGASIDLYDCFTLPNIEEYEIHGNRRSSPQIIELLNKVRPDFLQYSINTIDGNKPMLVIGDKLKAYQEAVKRCNTMDVHSLAFRNIITNAMNYSLDDKELADTYVDLDSDITRSITIRNLIKATEYAYKNELRDAWRQLDILSEDRTTAISYLRKLLKHRKEFLSGSLYNFYMFCNDSLHLGLKSLRKGKAKSFYETHTYLQIALESQSSDAKSIHKTIHKAKGEEFENVMVIVNNNSDLSVITSPNLYKNIAHRVYYVGMSRARKNLFINIEDVSDEELIILSEFPLDICDLRV